LNASDANTNNVLLSETLTSTSWLHINLKLGDTITFASADGKTTRTVTIVGIISRSSSFASLGKVISPVALVNTLSPVSTGASSVFYLKVDPTQLSHAEDKLGQLAPNATVQDLTSTATSFFQQLNSILDMFVAIASLSVVAAIIIIANAVALAMLERRRELGILKAVGYTSNTVLSEVMIENGIIGGVGAFLATLLASGGIALLGNLIFNFSLNMPALIVAILVAGSALLAILIAALVAWGSVRLRPLEVLRYE
jgi:ABC-type antimicrobial peptide transport system permease subunit